MMRSLLVLVCIALLLGCVTAKLPRSVKSQMKAEVSVAKKLIPDSVRNGVASALSTGVVKGILQPFDTIKTIQQLQKVKLNAIDTCMDIVKSKGFAGLWSGVGVTIIGSAPSAACYYSIYSSAKLHLTPLFPPQLRLLAVALAAIIGNTFASVLRAPYEIFKQRLQAGEHPNLIEALKYTYHHEGLFGLFGTGKLQSQILRDVPYAVFVLVTYEMLQGYIARRRAAAAAAEGTVDGSTTVLINKKLLDAMCGSIAGGVGTFLTSPMDVIKTRLMTSNSEHTTILQVVSAIVATEGVPTFFVGASSRLMHKIPANGLFFLCYEWFKSLLGVTESGAT